MTIPSFPLRLLKPHLRNAFVRGSQSVQWWQERSAWIPCEVLRLFRTPPLWRTIRTPSLTNFVVLQVSVDWKTSACYWRVSHLQKRWRSFWDRPCLRNAGKVSILQWTLGTRLHLPRIYSATHRGFLDLPSLSVQLQRGSLERWQQRG